MLFDGSCSDQLFSLLSFLGCLLLQAELNNLSLEELRLDNSIR